MEQDKVIFRQSRDRQEVFALLPERPGDPSGTTCLAFNHAGTRFAANISEQMRASSPVAYGCYSSLADLLTALGFNLNIVKRETPHMREVRMASVSM